MLTKGNILYFTPFYFKNGNLAKNKYFVVLSTESENTILAVLPTSKDHIPYFVKDDNGCIEIPSSNFNCFVIRPDQIITECGKSMPLTSYIYGEQLDTHNTNYLREQYQSDADYEVFGKMKEDIFYSLIDCLKKSKSVKRKYKRML